MRKDQKGFTLVELLIAIVILAIIVAPLLHAFVLSANTNAKARRNLNATTLAENIAEGLKAHTMEEIAYQCDYPSVSFNIIDKSVINGAVEELLYDGSTYSSASLAGTPSTTSAGGGLTYEFVGQPGGIYYFYLQNLKLQNQEYDALIRMDAAAYRAGGTESNLYNDQEISSIASVKGENNGFFIQELSKDSDVLTSMQGENGYDTLTAEDLYRDITIKIEKKTAGSSEITTAKAAYQYTGKLAGKTDLIQSEESLIFDNKASGQSLKNIYLFYTPLYTSKAGMVKDTITIDNPQDVPVNVYVIKQEVTATGILQTNEALYRMKLDILEGDGSVKDSAVTKLRTNLDRNLAATYIDGIVAEVEQANYTYNGLGNQAVVRTKIDWKDLSAAKKEDRIYNMQITVYEKGCHDGTGYEFPEGKKVYEITGSTEE